MAMSSACWPRDSATRSRVAGDPHNRSGGSDSATFGLGGAVDELPPAISPADAPRAFRPSRPRSQEPPAEATTAGATGPPTRPGGPSGTARPKQCTVHRCTQPARPPRSPPRPPTPRGPRPTTARAPETRPVPIPASRRSGRPRRRPHHGAEPGHCRASPGRRLSRIARRSTLPLPCHPWRRPLPCQGAELPVLIRELPLLPGHATPSGPGLPCADPCSPALCGDTVGSPVGSWSCGTEESRSPGPSLEDCACVGLTTVGTGRPAERLSVTDRGCL
jgi:hypothetical protein